MKYLYLIWITISLCGRAVEMSSRKLMRYQCFESRANPIHSKKHGYKHFFICTQFQFKKLTMKIKPPSVFYWRKRTSNRYWQLFLCKSALDPDFYSSKSSIFFCLHLSTSCEIQLMFSHTSFFSTEVLWTTFWLHDSTVIPDKFNFRYWIKKGEMVWEFREKTSPFLKKGKTLRQAWTQVHSEFRDQLEHCPSSMKYLPCNNMYHSPCCRGNTAKNV